MAENKKHAGGRPPKYASVNAMQEKIDKYFEDCKGHMLTDPNSGEIIRDKRGCPIMVDVHVPTITGLALALGLSRWALLDYQGKAAFNRTVTVAKSRVEAYVEERLFDRAGFSGARFSLQNNFKGWNDDEPVTEERTAPVVNIICDIPHTGRPGCKCRTHRRGECYTGICSADAKINLTDAGSRRYNRIEEG